MLGITVGKLTRYNDNRGAFREVFKMSETPIVQVNLSSSYANVLRGMHYHKEQTDVWVLVNGMAYVNLYDLRTGQGTGFIMLPDQYVIIPPLVAHGFYSLQNIDLLYGVTKEYDGSDEFGFNYKDVGWPESAVEAIISERDSLAPPLSEIGG